MLSIETDEILRIDEIIAKSRQIVNDSLLLTKRSQDRFKTPFIIKELNSDIIPSSSPVDTRIPGQILKTTPVRTPKSPSVDFESKFLNVDYKPTGRASWASYEDAPELKTSSQDYDRYRHDLLRLNSEYAIEVKERRHAENRVKELVEALENAQAEAVKAQSLLSRAKEEVSSLMSQVKNSEEQKVALQAKLTAVHEEHSQLVTLLEQKDSLIEQLQLGHDAQQAKDDRLEAELTSAKQDIAKLHQEYGAQLKQIQDDLQHQVALNHDLRSKTDNRYSLNTKLLLLEEQLHSLRNYEADQSEPVSLRKLHELEAKLQQTNDKYEQLAEHFSSRNSPARAPSIRAKVKVADKTQISKKAVKNRLRICTDCKKKVFKV